MIWVCSQNGRLFSICFGKIFVAVNVVHFVPCGMLGNAVPEEQRS